MGGRVGGKPVHWDARIVRTDGVVDSNSRVYYAIAQVNDPYNLRANTNAAVLAIGSFVNATLQGVSAQGVFSLPHSAVRNSNQVMIMDQDQRLRTRTVNVLRTDKDFVYVDDGIRNGEQVIVSPVPVPIEGMRVATEDNFVLTPESSQ